MGSFNFCPSCGHKIEGNPKFCTECGKPLTASSTSEQTFSKLGSGFSLFFNKAFKTAAGLTSKVKENLNEKKEASKRSAKISALSAVPSKEYSIANIPIRYGDGIFKPIRVLAITNKSINIYGKSSALNKKSTPQLLLTIDFADIKEICKYNITYNIITAKETYTITIPNEPYKFALYLSRVVKIYGNLYNIDLFPDEKIVYIANGSIRKNISKIRGTLYYTNKRIIFAKLPTFESPNGEGSKVIFSIRRDKIEKLAENRGKLSCNYTIATRDEEYTFIFNGLVPKSFIKMVPGAEGNKDIIERKKKVGKILKVASFAASFIGLGELLSDAADIDTGDFDVDADSDYADDMDVSAIDINGDGNADAIEIDSNSDGQTDAIIADTDGDGIMDSFMADENGDGNVDTVGTDTDGDGSFDKIAYDTNGDGNLDTIKMDSDGDGVVDM